MSGRSGDVVIEAKNLFIRDITKYNGGYITTDSSGTGSSGNISISVTDTMSIMGGSGSGLFTRTSNSAKAGDINLNVGTLNLVGTLTPGDRTLMPSISTGAFWPGTGQAGNIGITATGPVSLYNGLINQGRWRFKDESVAFGKGHHAHKYPVGQKAHSVRTVNGVPMATIITAASVYDQKAILPLLDELKGRYRMEETNFYRGIDNVTKGIFFQPVAPPPLSSESRH